MPNYLLSVGMEVHAELTTRSKMFCRCPVAFGGEPNTRVCPICLGLPGALPVPNRTAIEFVMRAALALNCNIARHSIFHRKNYFYPDLPKGYQISQYGETNPIGYGGWLDIETSNGPLRVKIRRVHLEEDTGKLMHLPDGSSGVDYNRAGVPLMEIVTEFPPDLNDAEAAKEYVVQLRQLLVYLGVCDGRMEEGSLRCEPNISVRRESAESYGTKTELKNLNSFRSVQLGVAFEERRQIATLESGDQVAQETRGWNDQTEASFSMRIKEEENDYRYFPDPDLAQMRFSEDEIEQARASLPELPREKLRRYRDDLGLSGYEADWLTADLEWTRFFESAIALGGDPKKVYNLLSSDFSKLLNGASLRPESSPVQPAHLVELIELVASGEISGKMAKEVLSVSFQTGKMPSAIVRERGATQISDHSQIVSVVEKVMNENLESVAKLKSGNVGVKGYLVGLVMKATQGRANPQMVQEAIDEVISR